MSRKGENIYHRKDGRWEGRYLKYAPGEKPKYGYVYAQTYRECREKQRAAAAQWHAEPPKPQTATGFCTVAEQWERQLEGRSSRAPRSNTTKFYISICCRSLEISC